MNNNTLQAGVLGEKFAADFLKKKKYRIVEKNFRASFGEIDIVAIDEDILVFIDVETGIPVKHGSSLENISDRKLDKFVKTVEYYVNSHLNMPGSSRIDAISVDLTRNNTLKKIKHVKNVAKL